MSFNPSQRTQSALSSFDYVHFLWHLANSNSSWLAAVGISFIAVFFVYGYARTGQLWLPIGLHVGWNFFQRTLGFPVSGYSFSGLLEINVPGPELWTGGAFGPEAGLIILPICVLGSILIYQFTKQREHAEGSDSFV